MELPSPEPAPLPPAEAWRNIPKDMIVAPLPFVWASNVAPNGHIWLWLRTFNQCSSWPFAPDAAEHLAKAVLENVAFSRQVHPEASRLQVVEAPILGPDGRPLT